MINEIILQLEKINRKIEERKGLKRKKKIKKLTSELWILSAVHRVSINDLSYIERQCKINGKDCILEVEYYKKNIY